MLATEEFGAMQLNPRQVEAFRLVMLRGSVTGAAQLMNVSQPAVSRLIRDLETKTGLTLFERQGNQLMPTPEANLLLAEVERYAAGLTALATFAKELSDRRRGSLSVVAMPAMAMGYLPRFMARFVEGRDLSRVYLHGMPSHLVIEAVAAGQADVGFAAAPPERPGLAIAPLEASVVVALPKGHRMARRRSLGAKDLMGERIVALVDPTIFVGPVPPDVASLLARATIVTPLTGIACQFVAAGAGIALVDPFVASTLGPEIDTVPFAPTLPIRIAIVTSAHRRPSTIVREFVESLKAQVASSH